MYKCVYKVYIYTEKNPFYPFFSVIISDWVATVFNGVLSASKEIFLLCIYVSHTLPRPYMQIVGQATISLADCSIHWFVFLVMYSALVYCLTGAFRLSIRVVYNLSVREEGET